MKLVRQWTDCLPDNDGKRPRLNPDFKKVPRDKRFTYQQADISRCEREQSPHVGFIFTNEDPYIGIDVDVAPPGQDPSLAGNKPTTIPVPVIEFLEKNPTHVHVSPSGYGLHIIYKLNQWDRQTVNELRSVPNQSIDKGHNFTGELRWHKQFLTITNELYELSSPGGIINDIALPSLICLIPNLLDHQEVERVKKPAEVLDIETGLPLEVETLPYRTQDVVRVLEMIPPTYGEKAASVIEDLDFPLPVANNYDWWVLVGSACAHAATELRSYGIETAASDILEAFVSWSERGEGFQGRRDVEQKFSALIRSSQDEEHPVSFPLLKKIAGMCSLSWPITNPKTKAPINTELVNIEALMGHHGISLRYDLMSGGIEFQGPEEIMARFFCPNRAYTLARVSGSSQHFGGLKTLSTCFLAFLQAAGYKGMTNGVALVLLQHLYSNALPFDYFKEWVLSRPWDRTERVTNVLDTITFSDEETTNYDHYKGYIRKTLFALVGTHFCETPFSDVSAFLVFKGRENTRKSSWFRCLLPAPMAEKYMAFPMVASMMGNQDNLMRLLGQKVVTVVDECDKLFTQKGESLLKSIVSQTSDSRRKLYEEEMQSFKRFGVVVGTTNQTQLYIGDHGSRKVWQIPVKFCDTDTLYEMDIQQMYAEVLYGLREFEAKYKRMNLAWSQNAEEVLRTNVLNNLARERSEIDEMLYEVFGDPIDLDPFDGAEILTPLGAPDIPTYKNRRLWTVTRLRAVVEMYTEVKIPGLKAFKAAATRYCAAYTGTLFRPRKIGSPSNRVYDIDKGVLRYNSKPFFVTPLLLTDSMEGTDKAEDLT